MSEYYVVGGVYTDLSFTTLEPGSEETYGPYKTRQEALERWAASARFCVDNACHRLTVVNASPSDTAICYNMSILEDFFFSKQAGE